MSINKDLFKEAIADAKAVREVALANAKSALEEALTPKLQSMLAAKLNEMDDEDDDLKEYGQEHQISTEDALKDEEDEDFDLSEILAELDEEDSLPKNEEKPEDQPGYIHEKKDDEETNDDNAEEAPEEEKIADMSVEELTALIKDIVNQEVGADEAPADDETVEAGEETLAIDSEEAPPEDVVASDEDEIDLEELLAELDAFSESDTKVEEAKKSKEDMKETLDTINALRNELNEVNLLNAKLLYVNKIFKAKNLSESQKLKVINSFDKATTTKEAKVVFESLSATLEAISAKKTIKESFGFASKAAGNAPNKVIVESNDVITRMQKLANIIK